MKGRYRKDYALLVPNYLEEHDYEPFKDGRSLRIRLTAAAKNGSSRVPFGRSEQKKITVKYLYDKKANEFSSNPQKVERHNYVLASTIISDLKDFEGVTTVAELVQNVPDFVEDLRAKVDELREPKMVYDYEEQGLDPVDIECTYIPPHLNRQLLNECLMRRNKFDPGTEEGMEGQNEVKFTKRLFSVGIKSVKGIYLYDKTPLDYKSQGEGENDSDDKDRYTENKDTLIELAEDIIDEVLDYAKHLKQYHLQLKKTKDEV